MDVKPLDVAQSFYEIAVPVFISLKEEIKSERTRTRTSRDAGELTFTQLRILLAIEYGKDQVGKLARSARVAQPAMSKIVDYLIGLGFVRRDPLPTDRRQIKLSLTAKGAAMTQRVRRKAAEKYVGAITKLSAKDRENLTNGIKVMLEIIEATKKENL